MPLALFAMIFLALVHHAAAAPIEPGRVRVIDGDTIRIDAARPDWRARRRWR